MTTGPKLPSDLARPLARIRRDLARIDDALTGYDQRRANLEAALRDDLNAWEGNVDVEKWMDSNAAGFGPHLTFAQAATILRMFDRPLSVDHDTGITQLANMVRDHAKRTVRQTMPPGKSTTVEGVGTLERCSTGTSTTWDGPALVGVLAARVADDAVDRETGEIKPPAVIAHEAARVVADAGGLDRASATFRVTSLEAHGIDPNQYRNKQGGRPSVRFTD